MRISRAFPNKKPKSLNKVAQNPIGFFFILSFAGNKMKFEVNLAALFTLSKGRKPYLTRPSTLSQVQWDFTRSSPLSVSWASLAHL